MALKEKECNMTTQQKNMQEKLLKAEGELYKAHDVVKEQQRILQQTDVGHKDKMKRLMGTNTEFKNRLATVMSQYKKLEEDHE